MKYNHELKQTCLVHTAKRDNRVDLFNFNECLIIKACIRIWMIECTMWFFFSTNKVISGITCSIFSLSVWVWLWSKVPFFALHFANKSDELMSVLYLVWIKWMLSTSESQVYPYPSFLDSAEGLRWLSRRLSQVTLDGRRVILFTCPQPNTLLHTCAQRQVFNEPNVHIFGMWEEVE